MLHQYAFGDQCSDITYVAMYMYTCYRCSLLCWEYIAHELLTEHHLSHFCSSLYNRPADSGVNGFHLSQLYRSIGIATKFPCNTCTNTPVCTIVAVRTDLLTIVSTYTPNRVTVTAVLSIPYYVSMICYQYSSIIVLSYDRPADYSECAYSE